jgi:hypothetical protein
VGSLRVAWWNLENLFDTVDDPISPDFDFTPANGWTHTGPGPELPGAAEVEGDQVFEELLAATGNSHLKVVEGSPRDERPARNRRLTRLRQPQTRRPRQAVARRSSA